MWKYNKEWNFWSITKTSGFITLVFELWKPFDNKSNIYRLSVKNTSEPIFKDFSAKDFEDAKLGANELIYDALRWNN